ncbi:hypothetical protein JOD45_001424 [Scopulibacillus daqui]|uniref:YneQ n=1 Tax=Scopulibacillus daqui TaxID=1469162 RepID=A0ABS2PYT1_9BACL|nr:hypothetical protein [Scopulibacillus daqui]MBM7645213.1 hypothetical protein [Scopulibacillus daqui]
MAFGLKRQELNEWKRKVLDGEIAFITHYWYDPRFPDCHTVTKVGCINLEKLAMWGRKYGLKPEWIDSREDYPHYDLLGEKQINILNHEGYADHIERFNLKNKE